MDNDPIDHARKQKGMRNLGVIMALIVLLSILFFFWGFINRGTINIIGEAPFSVEVYGGETFQCEYMPCEISQKRGIKDLIITKEDHKTIITSAKVKLWRTVDLEIEFNKSPQIVQAQSIPEQTGDVEYELIEDSETGNYKLIEAKDPEERAIVYFPNKVEGAAIFGNKNYALVASENSYFIDNRLKTRQKLTGLDLSNITNGKLSLSGNYFVYSEKNSQNLRLLNINENKSQELLLINEIPQTAWIYNDYIIFVTKQSYQLGGGDMNGSEGIIPVNEVSSKDLTFGIYNPGNDDYFNIKSFSEITEIPESLIPTINGKTIYFQSGEGYFKIEL
ncbi:MAG: hypothetical protein O3B47_02860 [bacterium]|nr:hypothetical protein [bacterium]